MAEIKYEMFLHITIFVLSCSVIYGEEILGCGGFVKSKVKIDFSKVEVRLVTPEGIQKYQTECAPNNGYYMVPFVDKGDFILKVQPPSGWTFEPMSVNLHVDGVNDPCSQGKDINFEFLGFSVSGQVKSSGIESGGPSGVTLKLMSKDSSKVIETALSTDEGRFQFHSVFPGKYKIIGSHESFTFKQNEIDVVVAESNVQCTSSIIVSGYDAHGKVSAAELPVKDVHLLLFSEKVINEKVKGCDESPPAGSEDLVKSQKLVFLCSVTSDGKGAFVFPSLQPQEYILVPFHKGEHIEFDVEPPQMKFVITHGTVKLPKNFAVTGFSVTGRVLDAPSPHGKPVIGAKVFVNSKEQAITNEKGQYRLQHMNRGRYKISLEKEDIFFPISAVRVGPDTPRLADIVADRFSLCGQVNIKVKPTKPFETQQIAISISDIDGSGEKVEKLDADAKFCFQLAPGDYALEPIIPDAIKESGIQLDPAVQKVTLKNAPMKGIKFNQVLIDIETKIGCVDGCVGVKIELLKDGEPANAAVQQKVTTTANLVFKNSLPGTYHLKPIHDHWCWARNGTTITTKTGQRNVVFFRQFGFKLVCSVSHNFDMAITHHGGLINTFHLTKGKNQLCLAEPGNYILEVKSCHMFKQQRIVYNTSNPQDIVLQAFAHMTTTRITSTHTDPHMRFIIKSKTRDKEFKMTPELEQKEDKSENFNYVIRYQARENEKLIMTPVSDILLFEPESVMVVVFSGECHKDIHVFKAFKGLFIEGSITPPIEGVQIKVKANDKGKTDASLKTDAKGKYKIGPLNPHVTYSITARKEGYVFIQNEKKNENFEARKLSRISFRVQMDDAEMPPLPGVLITISGGAFRSNNLTDTNGSLVLTKLEPAQYYYKAVMKEYEFIPSSQVVDLKEGDELNIVIKGKRVAFSCFGSVTSLNGQPEDGVSVQAFSTTEGVDHAEETTTNEQGAFRIKGLLPNTDYRVEVRKSQVFDRVSPLETRISVENDDISDLRFIAFRSLAEFEITGNVVTDNEFLKYIKVVLYQGSDLSEPVATASLSSSPFFHFPPLQRDHKEYHVRLETSLDKSRYTYSEPAAGFYTAGIYKHITLEFHPQMKAMEMDTPPASYFTLPITILVLWIAYNHVKVMAWAQQLMGRLLVMYSKRQNETVEPVPTKSGRKPRKDKS